jgi:CRISPR-associated protein Csh2
MSTIVSKRSEILFLYDAKLCNPNGDPNDANRPRIDEETGKCLVTDVRLKRTVRDYLLENGCDGENGNQDIFIREIGGKPVTGTKRSEAYANREEYLAKFIDVRLFGGVSAPKAPPKQKASKKETSEEPEEEGLVGEEVTDTKKTFHFTGPVQFGMGKSLNQVRENFIKGTGAFTTSETSQQRTFREEYNITYGLIGFHGVINESAAKYVKTTDNDIKLLLEGLWNGTKSLLTRSKKGHMPRLLVKITYTKESKGFFIGELCERLAFVPKQGKTEDSIDDVVDFTLNTAKLNQLLKQFDGKIESVTVYQDDRLELSEPIAIKGNEHFEF